MCCLSFSVYMNAGYNESKGREGQDLLQKHLFHGRIKCSMHDIGRKEQMLFWMILSYISAVNSRKKLLQRAEIVEDNTSIQKEKGMGGDFSSESGEYRSLDFFPDRSEWRNELVDILSKCIGTYIIIGLPAEDYPICYSSGYLLSIGYDYIELLNFYCDYYPGIGWFIGSFINDIPMDKIVAVTHHIA